MNDTELAAISQALDALAELNSAQIERALEYIAKRRGVSLYRASYPYWSYQTIPWTMANGQLTNGNVLTIGT